MDTRMRFTIMVLLLVAPATVAQTPEAIVNRAIQAHGGADVLAKMKAVIVTSRGKANFGGPEVEGTREAKWALPDRAIWILDFPRERLKTTLVVNGLSGWQQVNTAPAMDMPPTAYNTMVDDAYAYWLSTVAPLSRKDLTITPGGEATIDGQPAIGVKITKADRPEAVLYFSKANGLLLKVAYKGREAGTPTPKEIVLSDHKEFERIKLPTKVVDIKSGMKMGEWQVTDYKFVDKFDAGVFRKP